MAYIEVEKGNGRKRGIFSDVCGILFIFSCSFEAYLKIMNLLRNF